MKSAAASACIWEELDEDTFVAGLLAGADQASE